MKFEKTLTENGVTERELPQNLQNLIAKARAIEYDLDEEDDDRAVSALAKRLSALDTEIRAELEEHLDDEPTEDEPESELHDRVLSQWHTEGKTSLTAKELAQIGLKTPTQSKFRQTVGAYTLTKIAYESTVRLTKN